MKYTKGETGTNLRDQLKLFFEYGAKGIRDEDAVGAVLAGEGWKSKAEIVTIPIPHGVRYETYYKEISNDLNAFLKREGLNVFENITAGTFIYQDSDVLGTYATFSRGAQIHVQVVGQVDLVDDILKVLKDNYPSPNENIVSYVKRAHHGGLIHEQIPIPTLPECSDYRGCYPYFSQGPDELWREFEASSANVLLLIGPPGTGKSSFITYMLKERGWENDAYLTATDNVITDPQLPDFVREFSPGSVFIAEDADNMVMKREDGNLGMAGLLNLTSGVAPVDTKVIISTNLKHLAMVDPALLRPGRMFKVLSFELLTPEEGNRARMTLGKPLVDFVGVDKLTLAEALNWENANYTQNKPTFGFAER